MGDTSASYIHMVVSIIMHHIDIVINEFYFLLYMGVIRSSIYIVDHYLLFIKSWWFDVGTTSYRKMLDLPYEQRRMHGSSL